MIELFDHLSIPYMLVGSYSSNYYGRPRSTKDADFVLILSVEKLTALSRSLGADLQFDPQMSFGSVTMAMRHVITHPESAFKIELFMLTDDPHDQSRFSRRQKVDFEGRQAWLPTAEDVIIQKLRWSRGGSRKKDIADAAEVLRLQSSQLDFAYIRNWTMQHQTTEILDKLLANSAQ
jgi:hypothetical protein